MHHPSKTRCKISLMRNVSPQPRQGQRQVGDWPKRWGLPEVRGYEFVLSRRRICSVSTNFFFLDFFRIGEGAILQKFGRCWAWGILVGQAGRLVLSSWLYSRCVEFVVVVSTRGHMVSFVERTLRTNICLPIQDSVYRNYLADYFPEGVFPSFQSGVTVKKLKADFNERQKEGWDWNGLTKLLISGSRRRLIIIVCSSQEQLGKTPSSCPMEHPT